MKAEAILVRGVSVGAAWLALLLAWTSWRTFYVPALPLSHASLPPVAGGPEPSLAPASAAAPSVEPGDIARLRARDLTFPVADYDRRRLRDMFWELHNGHVHEALDVMAPRGTPVVAVDAGVVQKLFTSRYGGLTLYQFDRDTVYCYYYAHLDAYAPGLREGQVLQRGELVGYVGSTGNASPAAPHLHFAVFKLGAEKRWWQGSAVDPYPLWAE